MEFSYGRFGSMKPKVIKFSSWSFSEERARKATIKQVATWSDAHEKNIEVYRMRALTKDRYLGFLYVVTFYIFYKDLPR